MRTSSVPRQLLVLSAVLASVLVVGSLMFFVMLGDAYDESHRVAAGGAEELTRSYTLLEEVTSVEDTLQRMVRMKDPDELEKALADIDAHRARIAVLTASIGAPGAAIRSEYEATTAVEQQIVDAALRGDRGAANDLYMEVASARYEAVKDAVRRSFALVRQSTSEAMMSNVRRAKRQMFYRLAAANVGLAAFLVYLWRLRRRITVRLSELAGTLLDAGGQLADTSAQVTSSSQTVSEGVNRQAAAIEETSASLEEIGATSALNATHAQQAKELAGGARASAEAGHLDMQEMMGAMDAIKSASGSIAGIIKTIDEIAFQTNLLALNAAVEAARAGQAGLGFAVVADEVRGLAQRSATAARETAASVEQVIAKSDRGVDVCGKVARSLEDIVGRARRVDSLVGEIAEASNQQRSGIEQVNRAVADMEKVTQAGAATAEETAATVLELNAQAEALRDVVHQLQLLAGEERARALAAAPEPRHLGRASRLKPRRAA